MIMTIHVLESQVHGEPAFERRMMLLSQGTLCKQSCLVKSDPSSVPRLVGEVLGEGQTMEMHGSHVEMKILEQTWSATSNSYNNGISYEIFTFDRSATQQISNAQGGFLYTTVPQETAAEEAMDKARRVGQVVPKYAAQAATAVLRASNLWTKKGWGCGMLGS